MSEILLPGFDEKWPHQFTKNGKGYEIGKNELGMPTYAQTYICVHCFKEYILHVQTPPPNPCPARNTKREMVRLKNGG